MNISRQHAKIAYDKESKSWLMTVQGKNGLTVNGKKQHISISDYKALIYPWCMQAFSSLPPLCLSPSQAKTSL